MTYNQIQARILHSLRHGPLDQFQIAADISQAPFRVRAELRVLRGQRLVRDEIRGRHIVWSLTERGYEHAFAGDQMRIAEVRR